MAATLGKDTTRAIMNHDPNTRTLEKYYLSVGPRTNLTAALLGENGEDEVPRQIEAARDIALNTLPPETVNRIFGSTLPALMNKIMSTDTNRPADDAPGNEWKNYKRRVRRIAIETLVSEESESHRREMTMTEYSERYEKLRQSSVVDTIVENARSRLASSSDAAHVDSEDDNAPVDVVPVPDDISTASVNNFLETVAEHDLEEDIENTMAVGTTRVNRDTDDETRVEADDHVDYSSGTTIPYEAAVRSFMEILLDDTYSRAMVWKYNPQTCSLCEEDDSVSPEEKEKRWPAKVKLEQHQGSNFHTPRATWIRKAKQRAGDAGGLFFCPYCLAVGRHNKSFFDIQTMVRHIETSKKGDQHNKLRDNDGWGKPEWTKPLKQSDQSDKNRRVAYFQRSAQTLRDNGVEYSHDVADREHPRGEKHPACPAIVMGGPHKLEIPSNRFGALEFSPMPQPGENLVESAMPDRARVCIPEKWLDIMQFDDAQVFQLPAKET